MAAGAERQNTLITPTQIYPIRRSLLPLPCKEPFRGFLLDDVAARVRAREWFLKWENVPTSLAWNLKYYNDTNIYGFKILCLIVS